MTMSIYYKNFAIAGVGNVGKFIAEELVNQFVAGRVDEVVLLTREVTFLLFFSITGMLKL